MNSSVALLVGTRTHRDIVVITGQQTAGAARVAGQGATLRVVVQKACRAPGIPSASRIRQWTGAALDGVLAGEVTVRVVGEAESAQLNGTWRGKQGATNVLSFPADDGEISGLSDDVPAGDIAICAPVLEREALEQGKAPDAHWAHIVIHGALHLAGYDHETPHEAEMMEARERELLAGFGITDPYRSEQAPQQAPGRRG